MGAIRDLVLFGQIHLLTGFISLIVFAFLTNLALGCAILQKPREDVGVAGNKP